MKPQSVSASMWNLSILSQLQDVKGAMTELFNGKEAERASGLSLFDIGRQYVLKNILEVQIYIIYLCLGKGLELYLQLN